jgi:hypothetical protein
MFGKIYALSEERVSLTRRKKCEHRTPENTATKKVFWLKYHDIY